MPPDPRGRFVAVDVHYLDTGAARVLRGCSARPLYVTAAGMEVAEAARVVAAMAGDHRMPEALTLVDRLARGLREPRPCPASARY